MVELLGGAFITIIIFGIIGTWLDEGLLNHLEGFQKFRARVALGILGIDLYERF